MIPDEIVLNKFLQSKINFFVYGPRATGKTTLLKKLFKSNQINFIYINCTLG